ncbi:pyridoxal-phosphate dependent enzyme [Haloarcula onubensis]|uniref:Pyridoxal-phosphate dependent enzyme n=1 Tax=Haloarcula onubensis TaxID=2950539 RepID=A0ABU2FLD5_9EURY|nr:pyridoxal-phosphate dependent enzyme [Halomicroarcula sp. S3CR25-11]MDS0281566.1 pyridoxal-phosphate dependent enzyme [Halomicroarcula sp. S3CR25-11]
MQTTAAVRGLSCTACGESADPGVERCPDCGAVLVVDYDADAVESAADCHPFPPEATVSIDEGATPLVAVPDLAAELGVESVAVKDEGRNPTGSLADRGFALAVAAAVERGADRVGTPSTGNGAQSAAAYAARADIESKGFVPSRCPFLNKAMVNVHGGDMHVVEGRYADAVEAFAESDEAFASVAPGHPFRIAGATGLALELLADREWAAPDTVVHPAGHGETVVGLQRGFALAVDAGLADAVPRIYAAQPDACAPIAAAAADGAAEPVPVDHPDTIVGPLEVPDPAAGTAAIDAIDATDGDGVAVPDKEILQAAVDGCELGPEIGATGGTAVAGVRALADRDAFASDDEVVLVNPVAGSKEADLLRSHLMSLGM